MPNSSAGNNAQDSVMKTRSELRISLENLQRILPNKNLQSMPRLETEERIMRSTEYLHSLVGSLPPSPTPQQTLVFLAENSAAFAWKMEAGVSKMFPAMQANQDPREVTKIKNLLPEMINLSNKQQDFNDFLNAIIAGTPEVTPQDG